MNRVLQEGYELTADLNKGYEPILVEAALLAGGACDGCEQLVLLGPRVGVTLQTNVTVLYLADARAQQIHKWSCIEVF